MERMQTKFGDTAACLVDQPPLQPSSLTDSDLDLVFFYDVYWQILIGNRSDRNQITITTKGELANNWEQNRKTQVRSIISMSTKIGSAQKSITPLELRLCSATNGALTICFDPVGSPVCGF